MSRTCLRSARRAFALLLMMSAVTARVKAQQHETSRDSAPMRRSMNGVLGISMDRLGSGTTWIPDAVLLPSRHVTAGKWMLMLNGFVFGQYDWQDGPRGSKQLGSINWAMLMADREVAGGHAQIRFMASLDPATVGTCGYPLLLQSGETCNGQPLVDRQHPHEFFKELAVVYERPIGAKVAVFVYAAPAGEPALGPVAFMHRPSAMDKPQAPLGHHWQDATHISFGVVTGGIFTRKVRLEFSSFNAHEPDESRWNFDPIELNSFSGRVTINPTANWSFTAGFGNLDNPERASPPESITRFVASALHGRALGAEGQWASAGIYGRNDHEGDDASHSVLLESEAVLDRSNTVFGRMEYVQKSAHDLQLSSFPSHRLFNVAAASVGYVRELKSGRDVTLGLGGEASVNVLPPELESTYGSRTPVGGMVFLRLRPRLIRARSASTEHVHE
jgi:hypothetical protein